MASSEALLREPTAGIAYYIQAVIDDTSERVVDSPYCSALHHLLEIASP